MIIKRNWKSLTLILALIMLAGTVIGGCGSDTDTDPDQSDQPPDEPLIFTYVSSSEPDLLDPAIWFTTTPVNLNVYQNLLEVNPPGSDEPFAPMLAESYSVSDDGLTWTFQLRQGVTFHDGTPFNAQAVKFSVERAVDIGEGPAYLWGAVDEMNILSEHEIEFELSVPIPFDYIVAAGYGVFMVSPTAVQENEQDGDLATGWFRDNAVGTGPYTLREWQRGEQMVLERYDDYWGGWEQGYPDIVVCKFVSEYSTARLMLEAGDADMVDFVPADQIADLKAQDGIQIDVYPSYETLYFHFNCQKEPTDNKTLRQALSYAFNYDAIDEITHGNAEPLQGVLPSSMWGFHDGLYQYSFDLDKAEQLLADAGYPGGGITLTMAYAGQDELQRQLAEMYKSDLEQIGVTLELEAAPWATIATNQRELETSYHVFSRYWWPDYVDPHDFVFYLLRSGIGSNYSFYNNPRVDELIDAAHDIAGIDRERAIEMYEEIQDIVVEDAQSVFVLEKNWVVPMRTWVKDYVYNPAYPRIVKFYGLRLDR